MDYRFLGKTDIQVSALCLGTMTFGGQNTEQEAFEQLNLATEQGINFIDTAEMYSIPTSANTCGDSETILGNWLQQTSHIKREELILATKVTGPSRIKHIRAGNARLDADNIQQAIDGSLKRLQTDYIDLYQLHWPDRNTNFFGTLSYQHRENFDETPIEETLLALKQLVDAGKVRAIGLSNETAWGAMTFIHLAKCLDLPLVCSIQNPYNLLNRSFELNLAEISHREQLSLLAYSPLAFGTLTGKYRQGQQPQHARCTLFKEFKRYSNLQSIKAIEAYAELADQYNVSLTTLALAFIKQQSFVTSTIIGATSLFQLKENIAAFDVELDKEITAKINKIHAKYTYPAS